MAISGESVYEFRQTGTSDTNGGGFVWLPLVNSTYKWTASGSGTDEYYVELAAGGNPSLTEATSCYLDGKYNLATNGTLGSLSVSQWDWGDNDSLGFSTVYVRLADGTDPDDNNQKFVSIGPGGGTDYSQQATAHATRTDIVIDGTTDTDITSAGDAFASDDIGNILYITAGTGFTVGRYEIKSVSGGVATLDRAVGTLSSTGGSGKIGGALDVLTDAMFDSHFAIEPGTTLFIKNDGTMTLPSMTVLQDGTLTATIRIIGYNATRGDKPLGSDRPTLAAGANSFSFDNFYEFHDLIVTTTHADGFESDTSSWWINCKVTNSSGSADRDGFSADQNSCRFYGCEGISTLGFAFDVSSGSSARLTACYAHDSKIGMRQFGDNSHVLIGCVFANCTTAGLSFSTNSIAHIFRNNIFYDCETAILLLTGSTGLEIINNIFSGNTTGISLGDKSNTHYVDYNLFHDNTTDVINIDKGPNTASGNPNFNDPENGDFTINSTSAAITNPALSLSHNTDITGDMQWNIGASMGDNAAGGGGIAKLAGDGGGLIG